MGLDSVELVMTVEEHFSIEIPDSVADKLVTVGKLNEFVEQELRRLGRDPPDPETVFNDLRMLISHQLSIEPGRIVPDASFVRDFKIDSH